MKRAPVTDARFMEVWKQTNGSPAEVAKILGFASQEGASHRRKFIEKKLGIVLASGSASSARNASKRREYNRRIDLTVRDATMVVVSDVHRWPGPLTTAQRGAIAITKLLKPSHKIINGDLFDGARISRHPAGMWDMEKRPTVAQELEACQDFATPFSQASPNGDDIWNLGNHCMRMEARLATVAPQFEGVKGFHLADHFPEWKFGMAIFVNDSLVIKHRYHNGMHAVYNNAVKSGRSMVTGHLHSLKVTPWTDYNGTRYGVDTGTLADPESKQFDYMEENPANWRAGFVVLTFKSGRLLMPEIVQVWDKHHVEFRGELIRV